MTAPCSLHKVHHPAVTVLHDVLVFPAELQNEVYGDIRHDERVVLCGTGKDSVLACISYMLGRGEVLDPKPGPATWALASRAVNAYEAARRA